MLMLFSSCVVTDLETFPSPTSLNHCQQPKGEANNSRQKLYSFPTMAETIAGSGADGSESPVASSSPLVMANPPVDGFKSWEEIERISEQYARPVPKEDVKTEEYVLPLFASPRHCFNSSRLSFRRKVQVQGFHIVIVCSIGLLVRSRVGTAVKNNLGSRTPKLLG